MSTMARHLRQAGRPAGGAVVVDGPVGPTQNNTTGSSFGGMQTCNFFLICDVDVTEILVPTSIAGTYELRIDASLVGTRTTTALSTTDFLDSSPLALSAGAHTYELTKTAGAAGWYYRSAVNTWVDRWLFVDHWQEAGGGEVAPFQMSAEVPANLAFYGFPPEVSVGSTGSSRTSHTFTVNPSEDMTWLGIIIGSNVGAEVTIEGVSVGTYTPATAFDVGSGAGWTASNNGIVIPFDTPQTLLDSFGAYDFVIDNIVAASNITARDINIVQAPIFYDLAKWQQVEISSNFWSCFTAIVLD